MISGGAGGGGTPTANTNFTGGNITGAGLIPTLSGGAAGGGAGQSGIFWGAAGGIVSADLLMASAAFSGHGPFAMTGGSGGGTNGAAGTGGAGGDGAFGCGGAGGGGGVTGGAGGRGGSGLVLISAW